MGRSVRRMGDGRSGGEWAWDWDRDWERARARARLGMERGVVSDGL